MTQPYYATVEDCKAALDVKYTARSDGQIKKQLEYASRAIEGAPLLNRKFYPTVATRYFDWPSDSFARSWRLWLRQDELISITTLVAGGTTISSTDYFLEPVNSGPPYNRVEIDLASSAAFAAGDTTQRAIAITGVWGHSADDATAGTITAAVSTTTATTIAVSDSSLIGVGDLIKIDSERMVVTGKSMVDTTQNASVLSADLSNVSITSVTAGTIAVDEVILIDSERMLVVDVAGTTLTVKRQWDGTVLAAHLVNADIYAPRTLTVTRGALGTTAATHSSSAAIARHLVPGPVQELCVALAVTALEQKRAGYARMSGSGENARETSARGLKAIKDDAMAYRRNRGPEAV